jgi:hypothetical protein
MLLQQPEMSKQPEAKSKRIAVWVGVIIILAALIFFNLNRIVVTYVYLFKTDSFKQGDKIYASDFIMHKPQELFGALKEIRPLTEKEARDTFFLDKDKKQDFIHKAQMDSLKPYVQNFSIYVNKEKLKKRGSAAIGTYLGTYIKHTKTTDGQDVLTVYYAIQPDLNVVDNEIGKFDLPPYYTFTNSVIYLPPLFAGNKESINSK